MENFVAHPKTMTTRQVAKQLHTTKNVVLAASRKCLPEKVIQHGKTVYWTEAEMAVILEYMRSHKSNNRSVKLNLTVENTSTSLTPSLRMIKAFKMFQDAANDEIERLRNEKELLTNKNSELQITLDESKEWYSIKRMEKLNPDKQFSWRLLKNESEKMGVAIKKVFDQNYGEVNSYHISVWESLYFDTLNYGDKRN